MAAVETRLLYAAFPWVAPSVNLGKSIIDFMQPLERARIKRVIHCGDTGHNMRITNFILLIRIWLTGRRLPTVGHLFNLWNQHMISNEREETLVPRVKDVQL